MNILLLGSGGRENAIAYAIGKSEMLSNLYAIPGNSGMKKTILVENIALNDFAKISVFAKEKK